MNNQRFVYVTYIAATREAVWSALIDGDFTKQYWGNEIVSAAGWKEGSKWQLVANDKARTLRHVGKVLENTPQKRLVLSWAEPEDEANEAKHSRVAMDLETLGDMVRLTITHEHLDSAMSKKVTAGWPLVMSSLKSLLETGRPLRF